MRNAPIRHSLANADMEDDFDFGENEKEDAQDLVEGWADGDLSDYE